MLGRDLNTTLTLIILFLQNKYLFFCKKDFYKKMSLKNPKTVRKCSENLQPQMPEVQFLKALIFPRALFLLQN